MVFYTVARSASASSVLMVSISLTGSILPATCTTLSSTKQRTTWAMASVSRMLARNLLPRPSPFEAPATRPAMSTNSMVVGRMRFGLTMAARASRRGSGIGTIPVFGSMVQKGKFSAAIPDLVRALNRVDLPTLGRPTMPQLNPMVFSPRSESGLLAVQVFHRAVPFPGEDIRQHAEGKVDAGIEFFLFGAWRTTQDEI